MAEARQHYVTTKEAYEHLARRPHPSCEDAEAAETQMKLLEDQVGALEHASQRTEHDCHTNRNLKGANDSRHGLPALVKESINVAGIIGTVCNTGGIKDVFTITQIKKGENSFSTDGKLNQLFSHSMTMVNEEEEPEEWLLNTVPGTPIKVFEQWIMGLPDKGRGQKFTSDHSDYQHYLGILSYMKGLTEHGHPFDQLPTTSIIPASVNPDGYLSILAYYYQPIIHDIHISRQIVHCTIPQDTPPVLNLYHNR